MHSQEPILAIAALTPCRFISLFLTAGVVGNLAQSREMRTHRLNLDDGRISSNTRGPLMVCGGNAALSGSKFEYFFPDQGQTLILSNYWEAVLALNTFAWSIPVGAGIKMVRHCSGRCSPRLSLSLIQR